MRKAINENQSVQVAVVILLALLAGVMLYMQVLKRGSEEEAPAPAATDPAAAVASDGTVLPTTPVAPSTIGTATEGDFVAGPGLPADIVSAYDSGNAVVILIYNPKALDDNLNRSTVGLVKGMENVSIFPVEAKDVATVSRITEGVGVDRTPALIVIKPKSLTEGPPQASINYGFRSVGQVRQQIQDALYKGTNVPYYPE